ncbi:MAG: GYDIA family GHMP kinase [Bergeyella sp.]
MSSIFSPGKLMLTSEYVALDGAAVLAVPTQLGQEFSWEEIPDGKSQLVWNALHQNKFWLNICLNYKDWEILETNLPQSAEFVVKTLRIVQELSVMRLHSDSSYSITTNLQFPPDFGLGSSSTLMNNLAEWAEIDAFELNDRALGGSGYDIAVAKEKSAVLFRITKQGRTVQKLHYEPVFRDKLIFIHLNQKQDSREGIRLYRSKEKSETFIHSFTEITKQVLDCNTIETFSELMVLHEEKLSSFLGIPTVKEKYFKGCPSFVKSLGAWGGDFVMTSEFDGHEEWFSERGFSTVFRWEEVIL